jgi:predicted nucleic acid-binding protein
MSSDGIAIDSSALITLFRSGQAQLLPQLFTHIIVPEAVWQEVTSEKDDAAAHGIVRAPWLKRESVIPSPRILAWSLGKGETAVLSRALEEPSLRVVIDDQDARRCAQAMAIPMWGTGGVLLLAKRRGLIPSVGEALDKIRAAGLWLSDEVVALIRT